MSDAGARFEALALSRRSALKFAQGREVPDDILRSLVRVTQSAPSAFNVQPYKLVLVRDAERRRQLATAMTGEKNAARVMEAPVTMIFAADKEPSKLVPQLQQLAESAGQPPERVQNLAFLVTFFGGEGVLATRVKQAAAHFLSPLQPMPSLSLAESWAYKNTMLAAQNYMLAATAHGLATSPMEGFDGSRVRNVVGMPERYGVPIVVPTGYAEEVAEPSLRYPPEQVVFEDTFGGGASFLR